MQCWGLCHEPWAPVHIPRVFPRWRWGLEAAPRPVAPRAFSVACAQVALTAPSSPSLPASLQSLQHLSPPTIQTTQQTQDHKPPLRISRPHELGLQPLLPDLPSDPGPRVSPTLALPPTTSRPSPMWFCHWGSALGSGQQDTCALVTEERARLGHMCLSQTAAGIGLLAGTWRPPRPPSRQHPTDATGLPISKHRPLFPLSWKDAPDLLSPSP